MPSTQLTRTRDWNHRIQRARDLSGRYPAAAEILNFYRQIAEFQKRIFDQLAPKAQPNPEHSRLLRDSIDFESAAHHFSALLSIVEVAGTPILKETAAVWRGRLQREWLSSIEQCARDIEVEENPEGFFARVCLQPYAELLAIQSELKPGFAGSVCPLCSGTPQLAVLRPEGDGGKRFLLCSFCITEWEFRRVLCPVCNEVDYQKLPRYSTSEIPAVRVEACNTCNYYLKSVDMTVEGLAVPIVDEIATAPLDLWALEHGYKKVHQNLMGF